MSKLTKITARSLVWLTYCILSFSIMKNFGDEGMLGITFFNMILSIPVSVWIGKDYVYQDVKIVEKI